MSDADQKLVKILDKRRADGSYRELKLTSYLVDFCSNDYLGFARSGELFSDIQKELAGLQSKGGSTGSRLITGNSEYAEALERRIASFHDAQAALIFNSGYDANSGFFSAVPQKEEVVIYDELVHASVRDGLKMSRARSFSFRHNDLQSLEEKLRLGSATAYIAVESVYSMDGDFAPLSEICDLADKYGAKVVVDEAHATGLFGPDGAGRVQEAGLQNRCYARIHTFGKALAAQGGVVLGSEVLKQFLINYARSFIFTTALPFYSLTAIKCGYDKLSYSYDKVFKINNIISLFKDKVEVKDRDGIFVIPSDSPIQSLVIPGNKTAKNISAELEKEGYYAKAILYPTVPRDKERLRICIHAFNTEEEVIGLAGLLNQLLS